MWLWQARSRSGCTGVRRLIMTRTGSSLPRAPGRRGHLFQIVFENAGTSPNRRRAGLNGEIFQEGILEAIIELGRKQLAVTRRENNSLKLKEASFSTTETDGAPGVETRLRLVN